MKKALEITLGVVTSIGGFLDAGSLATSLQAGARFGFRLMWATALGTVCAIFLAEMSGRLAIVTHHPLRELIHKRFGLSYSLPLLLAGLLLNLLVLASEIVAVAMAAQLATGVSFRLWALPAALFVWAMLWFLTFGVIEKSVSFAGLVTLAFVIAAAKKDGRRASRRRACASPRKRRCYGRRTDCAGCSPGCQGHEPRSPSGTAAGEAGAFAGRAAPGPDRGGPRRRPSRNHGVPDRRRPPWACSGRGRRATA